MIKFSKEKVLLLHQLIAQETGGSVGVRDEGLLESALETAFSGFGGQEFYPIGPFILCVVPDSGTPDDGISNIPRRMRRSDSAPPAKSANAAC